MKQLKVKILRNEKVEQSFYKMQIKAPYLAKNIKPGQFIEVRCSDSIEPLLRRPLGVHRITKSGIEILYEIVGKGTDILSRKKADEYMNVIGPLGNGFTLNAIRYPLNAILVAGGIGVAPLLALAEKLVYSSWSTAHRKKTKLYVLLGAKTKSQILCRDDFKKLGCEIIISTDDGSEGKCGFITDCLASLLSTIDYRLSTIYACGPGAMLEAVSKISALKGARCQVSLEERMACGVGVCLGCPVKVKKGYGLRVTGYGERDRGYEYKMVCKDGPVFDSREILW